LRIEIPQIPKVARGPYRREGHPSRAKPRNRVIAWIWQFHENRKNRTISRLCACKPPYPQT
jgi:hypothetical protein